MFDVAAVIFHALPSGCVRCDCGPGRVTGVNGVRVVDIVVHVVVAVFAVSIVVLVTSISSFVTVVVIPSLAWRPCWRSPRCLMPRWDLVPS